MSKEIFEQPITVKNCIKEYVDNLRDEINFYNFSVKPEEIRKIILIGCGTAYHSCLVAKYWFEEMTSLEVETDIASEFRYRNIKFDKKNLYIFVSQSGETADTAAALNICKKNISGLDAFCYLIKANSILSNTNLDESSLQNSINLIKKSLNFGLFSELVYGFWYQKCIADNIIFCNHGKRGIPLSPDIIFLISDKEKLALEELIKAQ